MYQIPLDNINFRPLDIWGLGVAAITDFLYYDPDSAYVDNASITNRGTSGTDAVGYSGKSYDFDGVSDFVDTNQTLSFERTDTLDITIWVKWDSFSGVKRIVTNIEPSGFFEGFSLLTNGTSGKLQFSLEGVSNDLLVETVSALSTGKWYKIRVTYDGSSDASGVSIFVDDLSVATATLVNSLSSTIISTSNLEFGAYGTGTGQFFDGQISDCSITINSVLTHYFEFNQASSTGIFDSVQGVLATNSGCALIEGLSGLENSETHNGIPQSFSKNWNRYPFFNGNDSDIIYSGDTYTGVTGLTYRAICSGHTETFANPFSVIMAHEMGDSRFNLTLECTNSNQFRFRVGTPTPVTAISTSTDPSTNSIGNYYDLVATARINAGNLETYLYVNGVLVDSDSVSTNEVDFGYLNLTGNLEIGGRGNDTYGYNGIIKKCELYHQFTSDGDVSGLTLQADLDSDNDWVDTEGNLTIINTIADIETILIPENPSSLGNDIFGNAIVDPQDKFKLDGASYGDTGQTVAIDYNTPFTITANGVYIYDSTSNNAIFSNRDNTANQRGVLAYLDTSNRPVLLMQLNTTTRVQVQSNVAISNDDNVQWISDGTGDASGVTLKINAAAVATTTLQDQDISTGITSAANAYFGIDLDGTANELKGSTGIITLDL